MDKELAKNFKMRDDFATEQLGKHLESLDHDNPRDFIDSYLIKMAEKKQKGEKTSFEGRYIMINKYAIKLSCLSKDFPNFPEKKFGAPPEKRAINSYLGC